MKKTYFNSVIHSLLIWSLLTTGVFSQSTTNESEENDPYKGFVHQSSVDKANDACASLDGYCGPNANHNMSEDIIQQWAVKAFGILTAGVFANNIWGEGHDSGKGLRTEESISDKRNKRLNSKIEELEKKKIGQEDFPDNPEGRKAISKSNSKIDKKIGKLENKQDKKQLDAGKICQLITIAGTAGVTLSDMLRQNQVKERFNAQPDDMKQTESLYTVANIHAGKETDSKIQAGIFSASAICYGGAVAQAAATNPAKALKYGVHAALAAGLATVSFMSAKKHKDVKNKALAAAELIPKVGECKPGTPCFCSENAESSKENHSILYEASCAPKELARNNTRNMAATCIDSAGKTDVGCSCLKSNSCFDSRLAKYVGSLGLSTNMQQALNESVSAISRGSLSESDLARIHSQGVYFSQKSSKIVDGIVSKSGVSLSDSQKQTALAFKQAGFSSGVSVAAATAKVPSSSLAKAKNLFENRYAVNSYSRKGKSSSRTKSSSRSSNREIDPFQIDTNGIFQQLQAVRSPSSNGNKRRKIERAQKKALEYAQVNPFEQKPIFEIISSRYLKSAIMKD